MIGDQNCKKQIVMPPEDGRTKVNIQYVMPGCYLVLMEYDQLLQSHFKITRTKRVNVNEYRRR